MAHEPVVIPEKIYFKIGEVCDLVGVEAHVLRYWETEFSMLSPQKNKSGQRSYRRRDVEMALRVKQLLYNEMFTIAGARKKLQSEQRDASKPKSAAPSKEGQSSGEKADAPMLFDTNPSGEFVSGSDTSFSGNQRDALKTIAANLLEIRDILKTSSV
jgi:DNA-binding transcriptional MerR regulator